MASSKRVTVKKPHICKECLRPITAVQHIETDTHIELFCLNDGCGVLILSKEKTV